MSVAELVDFSEADMTDVTDVSDLADCEREVRCFGSEAANAI